MATHRAIQSKKRRIICVPAATHTRAMTNRHDTSCETDTNGVVFHCFSGPNILSDFIGFYRFLSSFYRFFIGFGAVFFFVFFGVFLCFFC